jgi:hypothetical protein
MSGLVLHQSAVDWHYLIILESVDCGVQYPVAIYTRWLFIHDWP